MKNVMPQKGFTLVELIVALAFFSFMLLIVSVGFLQVNRIYQAGVASRRTQQAGRATMDDIAREIRAASAIEKAENNRLCLTGAQTVDYQRNDTNHSLTKRTYSGSCESPPASFQEVVLIGSGGDLGANTLIRKFVAAPLTNDQGKTISAEVTIQITTGFNVLFSGNVCNPTDDSSQFCSTTTFKNTVSLRGNQ